MTQPPSFWTEERVALLKALHCERKSNGEIAKVFGVTRNAICGKLSRMGMATKRVIRPKAIAKPAAPKPVKRVNNPVGPHLGRMLPSWTAPRQMPRRAPTEPAQRVSAKGVSIFNLTDKTCRWPLFEGDEPFKKKFFCGAEPAKDLPYCKAHAAIAYTHGRER